MFPIKRLPSLILLCMFAIASSGCIEATHQFYLRYDKDKDSFLLPARLLGHLHE